MNDISNEARETIKNHLLQEKIRLQTQLNELAKQDPFNDPEHGNDNAAIDKDASEESDHDRICALTQEISLQLTQVVDALKRIEDHTFGICSNCGNPIDVARIRAYPVARLCMACESI
jgi:DnaK suppressor protein